MFNEQIAAFAVLTCLVIAVSNWRAGINNNFFATFIFGRLVCKIRSKLKSS